MDEAATIDVDCCDVEFGPLRLLPGTWKGRASGWSVTALPLVAAPPGQLDYRLLLDRFDETLTFVPAEKSVAALEYEQVIAQVAAADRPAGDGAGAPLDLVHHEPGRLIHMGDRPGGGPTIGRLATVPYGEAALALGHVVAVDGPPLFEDVDVLPVGVAHSLENPYLEPYRFFHEHPFHGSFDPVRPQILLQRANQLQPVARTTVLVLDTRPDPGGTRNSPFVVQQPNATRMQSIFWINELVERDANGEPRLQLQYLQLVDLEFFPRRDGRPGRIRWPHVSVNTLEKVSS